MKLFKWQIIVTIFCIILGTALHFTYELSNYNPIVGIFSAVNESVWEHLKLLFYPMLLMSIAGNIIMKQKYKNYWLGQLIGMSLAMLFVVSFFFTYTGIIGYNIAIVDISSFIFGIIIGEIAIYKILKIKKEINAETLSILLIILILLSFIIFTFYPPILPLFEDPIYGTFGLEPKRID